MLTPDHAITHRHNDKCRNRFLKHKRVNNFLPNLYNTQTKQAHPDMTSHTYDDDFRRIAILKRPLNFFFLAFCVIYQNLLHGRVYIRAVTNILLVFYSAPNSGKMHYSYSTE